MLLMATWSKKILVLGWAPPDKKDVVEHGDVDGDLVQEDLSTWMSTTCATVSSPPPPHNPCCTLSRATAPCSYSALEFIKYPGVDGVLLMQTPSYIWWDMASLKNFLLRNLFTSQVSRSKTKKCDICVQEAVFVQVKQILAPRPTCTEMSSLPSQFPSPEHCCRNC